MPTANPTTTTSALTPAQVQNQKALEEAVEYLRGDVYRVTHQQSVTAILGAETRPVSSRGCLFFNKDRWTARSLVKFMCEWAKAHPGCVPTRDDVRKWVDAANNERVANPEIVIAATPDKLSVRVAMALTGGAYHEAFHTKYSARRNLTTDEVCDFLLARWARVADWSKYEKLLLRLSNVIEDIRIERRGREEFPGVETKMYDLQDFILRMEAKSRREAEAKGIKTGKPLAIIESVFRDVGLGYVTDEGKAAMRYYRQKNPDAVALVLNGPLSPMLREAISLTKRDDLGCIRLALEVVGALVDAGQDEQDEEDQQDQQQGGQGACQCPKCGAKGHKLVVRPKANPNGQGNVPGRGIVTCTVCGWQQEVELKEPDPNAPKQQGKGKGPKFEGFDDQKQQGKGAGKGEKDKDGAKGKDKSQGGGKGQEGEGDDGDESGDSQGQGGGKGKGKDKDGDKGKSKSKGKSEGAGEDEDEDGTGSGSGDEGDEDEDGEGQGTGEGDDGEGDEDGDEDGQGAGKGKAGAGDEDGDADGAGEDDGDDDGPTIRGHGDINEPHQNNEGDDRDQSDGEPGTGAGGHKDTGLEHQGNDFSELANDALNAANEESTVLDGSAALQGALAAERKVEDEDVKRGEAPYRPYDMSKDRVHIITPSGRGKEYDSTQAGILCDSVKAQAGFLRARLRNIVRAQEMITVSHGVRRGPWLAEGFLVDSRLSLMHGKEPKRAFSQRDETLDTSTAAWIVLDESGSMCGILAEVTRICCAICEPLDALGCATGCSGIRDGEYSYGYGYYNTATDAGGPYHRSNGVTHDVFKTFGEKFSAIRWRFANTQADGGTPLADGVQFGLDALSTRNEGHRILFVVTDGCPNGGHTEVIRHQTRLANEAGVHVIGVGLGESSRSVMTLFKDHILAPTVADMPKLLIAKLNDIVDDRDGKFRGRRVKDTRK